MAKELPAKNIPKLLPQPEARILATLSTNEASIVKRAKSGKLIRFYEDSDFKSLAESIQALAIFLTNNPINEIGLVKTVELLGKSFKDFNKEEIEQAVNMALAGELSQDHVLKYNFLSPQFLGSVLIDYRSVRNKAIVKYKEKQQEIELNSRKPSIEEMKKGFLQMTVSAFEKYKKNPAKAVNDVLNIWIYQSIYDGMFEYKLTQKPRKQNADAVGAVAKWFAHESEKGTDMNAMLLLKLNLPS